MKLNFFLIIKSVVLLLIGCNNAKQPIIIRYGYFEDVKEELEVVINPKNHSFDSLCNRFEEVYCNDSIPIIQIEQDQLIKKIKLFRPCWRNFSSCYTKIKKRNTLRIEDEKIDLGFVYGLNKIDSLIVKHYTNNGEQPYFSERPNKAIISINYKNIGISNIETLLNEITNAYDLLNLTTPLIIKLHKDIPKPPPPI